MTERRGRLPFWGLVDLENLSGGSNKTSRNPNELREKLEERERGLTWDGKVLLICCVLRYEPCGCVLGIATHFVPQNGATN
jgi:hypothetical protein